MAWSSCSTSATVWVDVQRVIPSSSLVLTGQTSLGVAEFFRLKPILTIHDQGQAAPLLVGCDGDRDPAVAASVVVGTGIDAVRRVAQVAVAERPGDAPGIGGVDHPCVKDQG